MALIKPSEIHRICVDCTGLIGDTLLRTPFIEALALICPGAKIDVIVYAGRESLIQNHPNVADVFCFEKRQRSRSLQYAQGFFRILSRIRRKRYDLYVDLYGGGHSLWLMAMSAATYRLGFRRTFFQRVAATHGDSSPEHLEHLGGLFAPLLQFFDISVDLQRLRHGATFRPTPEASHFAIKLFSQFKNPIVLLNLGGGAPRKLWPVQSFVEISEWLADVYKMSCGVFVNPGQENLFSEYEAIANQRGYQSFFPVKTFEFDEIGAVLKQSALHVTGDTGYMHIGFGVRTPTIGIFTYTRPEAVWPDDCQFKPCFRPDTKSVDQFNRPYGSTIPVTDVQHAIKTFLDELVTPSPETR